MSTKEMVQQAVRLLQGGKRAEARELLQSILIQDRDDPYAWALMVQVAESKKEAVFCLKQVLRLKPGDAWATGHLRRLERSSLEPLPGSRRAALLASVPQPEPLSSDTLSKNVVVRSLRSRVQSGEPMMPVSGVRAVPAVQAASPPAAGALPSEIQPQAGPALPGEQPATSATRLSRRSSFFALAPLIFIVVLLLVVALVVWNEFFAARPGDEERALQVAQEWTVALYRFDYGTMEGIACRRYLSQVRQAKQARDLVDIFAGALNVDLASEPPDSLKYEVISLKGNQARVRVEGFFGGLEMEGFSDQTIYTMRREGGDWKWCGQE